MSGRRFRIISDSEDEDNDVSSQHNQRTLAENSSQAAPNGDSNESDGGVNDSEGAKKKKKRRARLDSDDQEASESEDGNNLFPSAHRNERARSRTPENGTNPLGREDSNGSSEDSDNDLNGPDSRNGQVGQAEVGSDDEAARETEEELPVNQNPEDRDGQNEENNHNDDGTGAGDADEAEEASGRKIVRKRVVRNPQPKLDATRLTGERGLGRLRNMHPHIKLKGRGHEREDLRCVLHHLQLWGHRMFPRMQTKDIFERCERLGTKMPVKIYLRKMRTGQIYDFTQPLVDDEDDILPTEAQNDYDNPAEENNADEGRLPAETVMEDGRDLFEELMASEAINHDGEKNMPSTSCPDIPEASTVSDDLRVQIAAKRLEAIRKKEQIKMEREQKQNQQIQAKDSIIDGITEMAPDQQIDVEDKVT